MIALVLGSVAGTRLALAHGSRLIRAVFIAVAAGLVPTTGYDAYLR